MHLASRCQMSHGVSFFLYIVHNHDLFAPQEPLRRKNHKVQTVEVQHAEQRNPKGSIRMVSSASQATESGGNMVSK